MDVYQQVQDIYQHWIEHCRTLKNYNTHDPGALTLATVLLMLHPTQAGETVVKVSPTVRINGEPVPISVEEAVQEPAPNSFLPGITGFLPLEEKEDKDEWGKLLEAYKKLKENNA